MIKLDKTLRLEYIEIDLAKWDLPLLNEPGVPARQPYVHPHTKAWSQHIQKFDAFLFVTPQVCCKGKNASSNVQI